MFGEGERVARPAAIIERHGIGMPGEQQAAGAVSGAGQQIEFMARIRHRLYLDVEAGSRNQPASKLIKDSLL